MPEPTLNGNCPAHEIYDHPQHGRVVRFTFGLNHPVEELKRHEGRYVAWSMDGRQVLASASTIPGLYDEIGRLKLGDDDCVLEYISSPQ
jgi:hypothetical protein